MVSRINCLPREYSKLWKGSASTKPLSSAKYIEKIDIFPVGSQQRAKEKYWL
jgi:hypothetical protein